ncbi:MAG: HNH endonuclease, partial [Candidatus Helarchaeota archaeon]
VPKISQKIIAADEDYQGQRNIDSSLKQKLYEYQEYKCFYCGKDMGSIAQADHFIPYNYIFDSKIWNIVGACSDCNRKKYNFLVQEKYLEKLKTRNLNEKFQEIFKEEWAKEWETPSKINEIIENHYRNCLYYFKKIDI